MTTVCTALKAEDLTQAFFCQVLYKRIIADADRERGRFRAFLITAFKRFIGKEHAREGALKRSGGQKNLRLDFDDGEKRYKMEPTHDLTPERIFERQWAFTLLERILDELAKEMTREGKEERYRILKPFIASTAGSDGDLPTYGEPQEKLGMNEGAIKVAIHRLRGRYRKILRREISETLSDPNDVESEIQVLMNAVQVQ